VEQAEVGHGARYRSYIQGIARGDQDHVEQVALGFREHEMIVKQLILSDLGPQIAWKRAKIEGLQLLIRQQGKNASHLFRASYKRWKGRKIISIG
jgi:hypothetical protein